MTMPGILLAHPQLLQERSHGKTVGMMAAIGHGVTSFVCVFLVCGESTKNKEESKNVNVS